jgi:hypothetical protein
MSHGRRTLTAKLKRPSNAWTVVSVSEPSKSGKSILVVAGKDNLIRVFGAQIRAAEDIWTFALDWMDSPATRTTQSGTNRRSRQREVHRRAQAFPVFSLPEAQAVTRRPADPTPPTYCLGSEVGWHRSPARSEIPITCFSWTTSTTCRAIFRRRWPNSSRLPLSLESKAV